ncbi:hypothetical protein N7492_009133 [Penicillium capsulatum]|uniref:Alpha/beta hydrolase fold-3 domain-containing protein n=1 Tax=Penicillium capsulatum TaxID=69766 RepID=A0A9W9HUA8_9EURO|nr:hypothetical protein N7492_009133 [Penicillium capsulatum]KAJ6106532.1 hypothetical protein N7512_010049 [Penicillium capsulatum]
MPLQWDRDWHEAVKPMLEAQAANPRPPMTDPLVIRKVAEPSLWKSLGQIPKATGVKHEVHHVGSSDGHSIAVHRFFKEEVDKTTPAIVHAHGGGMVMGNVDMHIGCLSLFALKTDVPIFSVEYRRAPEHPFPTPVEDVYAGLAWLSKHALEFSVDPTRIGIMGESAGGNLAAGAALMARDRGLSPPLAKQILIYPMLDDRNTQPHPALEGLLMWTPEQNTTCWSAYLGADVGTDRVSEYAAPIRATGVDGLPPTYIDVGNCDIFRNESVQYASRIAQADIDVELHVYPGLPHLYDLLASSCAAGQRAMANRLSAMSSLWL